MKKLILFLLLFTGYLQAQTLPSPSYNATTTNTLKIKTPATVTSVNFLPAFDVDGITLNKISTINMPFLHLSGNETFSGVKSGTTAANPATAGIKFTNNYNGGSSDALNAPIQYINNLNGIGLGGQNNGIGILNASHNTSSGVLNNFSAALGSTGNLLRTQYNMVTTGWVSYLGEHFAPRFEHTTANKNNALLASGETMPNPAHRSGIYFKGKQIYFYGDSYTTGTGASTSANRWTAILADMLGAAEVNQGVAGTTLEKRVPIDYMASPNMIDNASTIPTKTPSIAMLVIAYGLNDMGQTASAYNVTNFISDYTTVINSAISKGWETSQILIIPPYYIGSSGYTQYATITGNAAPTTQRHLDFVDACRQVAQTFGTMYFDIYDAQKKNNTTLFSDPIHPNDAGYRAISMLVANYLGVGLNYNASSNGYIPKTINESLLNNSAIFEDAIGNINIGATSPNITQTGRALNVSTTATNGQASLQLTGNTAVNGNVVGAVYFGNNAGLGLSNGAIYATREGGNANYSDIHFDVRGLGGYRTNALRLFSTGGIGIGNAATDPGNGSLNITGNVTAANLLSGTYTPTFTNTANITGSTGIIANYTRVGDMITVYISFTGTVTTAATLTTITISLPVNRVGTTNIHSGSGSAAGNLFTNSVPSFFYLANNNNQVIVSAIPTGNGVYTFSGSFMYKVN